jgi:predicted glycosyltransferase involved in capsule biosynthesis
MNTYHAFHKTRKLELQAETSYQAQQKAAAHFKAKKSHEVSVVLVAKGDAPVTHTADF